MTIGLYKNLDYVVVLDSVLLDKVDVLKGLKKRGLIIINSEKPSRELQTQLYIRDTPVFTLNAKTVSMNLFGRFFPNTPMLGALTRVTRIVKLESAMQAVSEYMEQRLQFSKKLVELNVKATQLGYESVLPVS